MKTIIRSKKTCLLLVLILAINTVFANDNAPKFFYQPALLQKQLVRFAEIERRGGWEKLTLTKKQYKEGETASFVKQLKKR